MDDYYYECCMFCEFWDEYRCECVAGDDDFIVLPCDEIHLPICEE